MEKYGWKGSKAMEVHLNLPYRLAIERIRMKALIIIDIQNGLTRRNSLYHEDIFLETINSAIKTYRDSDSRIVFVQHNNNQLKSGTFDWEIDRRIDRQESDTVVQKSHGNAFQKTDLKTVLSASGINSITIGGLVSHGCVKATCLGGLAEGFETSLLKNGHTNWNKDAQIKIADTEEELVKSGILLEEFQHQKDATNSNKSLNDLTTEEFGRLFPIIIQEYTDKWIDLYQTEKQLIRDSILKSEIVSIEHIGSTAIPGLKAKPTIDILLQISDQIDIQKLKDVFKSLGYQLNKRPDKPSPHLTFVKGYTIQGFKGQAYHVHIRFKGDWDEIRFRDYLIKHADVAKEYETLKMKLADKYKNDREKYTDSKKKFIERINKLTRKQ
ncbi:MAG: isochorismatase family protein [Bacteroidales bacterium]|nr:isochorismatase family protein [Bacteroidales bacterium]